MARRGERVGAVDQQGRRPVHPGIGGLTLIGDLAAAHDGAGVGGQRGREPCLERSGVRAGRDGQHD